MPRVKDERSFWRDMELSLRHRKWGWDCPAIDIDFLMLEYDKGKASAIVEYKHELATLQYPSHASYQALIDLANSAGKPLFANRYKEDFTVWTVTPLNEIAKNILPQKTEMNEKEWVSFLYKLRGREVPNTLFDDWDIEI